MCKMSEKPGEFWICQLWSGEKKNWEAGKKRARRGAMGQGPAQPSELGQHVGSVGRCPVWCFPALGQAPLTSAPVDKTPGCTAGAHSMWKGKNGCSEVPPKQVLKEMKPKVMCHCAGDLPELLAEWYCAVVVRHPLLPSSGLTATSLLLVQVTVTRFSTSE